MKAFVVATLLVAACSASYLGPAVSSQYHNQDSLGQYAYGYADPNSQKHESRSAHGITEGGYSYVDANGIVQSVKYVADPINGFRAAGTNFPKAPAPVAIAPIHVAAPLWAASPVAYTAPIAYAAPWAYSHGLPVAPAKTPEVQAAEAAHAAAHAHVRANLHHLHKRSLWGGHAYAAPWAYPAAPVVIQNGVPVETPEVQHAKAEHAAAHARVLSQQHVASAHLGYAPAALWNGAPVETPEVQHAKAAHFAAHAAARSGHAIAGPVHYGGPAHYAEHIPVIQNGVPVDTPEVQHAKAAHFNAVAEAKARSYSAPAAIYGAPAAYYHGAQHIPIIQNGVPVETPEVQHAKAAHLNAVAEAKSRSNSWSDANQWDNGHWDNGHHAW